MNNLLTTLDKMLEVLSSINAIMNEEQELLSAGRINSSQLQRITEDKTMLLSTLNYLDEMRKTTEKSEGIQAPYDGQHEMARRWQDIQQRTGRLRDTNTHNGLLLKHQMQYTEQALAVLKPHQSQPFYGPDGQAKGHAMLSRKA